MQSNEPTEDLQRNLHENESFQWVVEPNRTSRFIENLTSGLVAAAIIGVFVGAFAYMWGGRVLFGLLGFLAPVVLQVGNALVGLWLDKIEYAATDQRLMSYSGRFGRSLNSVPFDGIQDAEYDVTPIENLFDVGTVTIDTDRGYETMTFHHVPDPQRFAREVASLAAQRQEEREAALREQ